jgi:hypothetical protein
MLRKNIIYAINSGRRAIQAIAIRPWQRFVGDVTLAGDSVDLASSTV